MANGNQGEGSNPPPSYLRPALWIILVIAAVFWSGILSQLLHISTPVVRWFATMIIMVVILAFAGLEINGRAIGFLIDSRYKISLSRLQITFWTIITLSAYLTIALPRTLPDGLDKLTPEVTAACTQRVTEAAKAADNPPSDEAISAEADLTCKTPDPLNITFPSELIAALGISAASFAGSTLVQNSKKSKQVNVKAINSEAEGAKKKVDDAQADYNTKKAALDKLAKEADAQQVNVNAAQEAANTASADQKAQAEADLAAAKDLLASIREDSRKAAEEFVKADSALVDAKQQLEDAQKTLDTKLTESEGLLHKNSDPSQARLSDLFRAEEIGTNYKVIDMSKVQMFFFTVVIIFAYSVALSTLLQNGTALKNPLWVDLPPFSATLNTLLAISHGAYLSVKTVDRTPSTN
jgi:hypothetical protein